MKKQKSFFKLVFISIISFTIYSCTEDLYEKPINSNQFKFKTVSFEKVKELNNKTANFIENKILKSQNINARTSQFYGKEIDTTKINYLLKDDGFSSFTFKVETQTLGQSYLENIVVENKPNGSQDVLLIKYNLNNPIGFLNLETSLNNSLISTEVYKYENNDQVFARVPCIEVGYYVSVEKCQGELVTPGNEPHCFNSDGSMAMVEVFVVVAEDCDSNLGGGNNDGGFNGNPPDGFNNGNGNNSGAGGGYSGSGIFIPNVFSGDADPNNAGFMLAGQVAAFTNTLPTNLQSLISNYNFVYPYIVDFCINNGNSVSSRNTQKITTALNNFYNFQPNTVYNNLTNVNIERFNFWAFYTFLNNNPLDVNNTKINNIKNFIQSTDFETANPIVDYLYENKDEDEAIGFVIEITNLINQNNYNFDSIEELSGILDILDDGNIDGQQVVVAPDTPITNMAQYLSIFNTSIGATITIYADQPKNNSDALWTSSGSVGHAFISIQQGTKVVSLGFYPQNGAGSIIPNTLTLDPTDFSPTAGAFGNDGGHDYDVSLSVPINASALANLINGITNVANSNPLYNLGSLNCTDMAILFFESGTNINIPSCESPGIWSGQTPGTLGQILKGMSTPINGILNTFPQNAPLNNTN